MSNIKRFFLLPFLAALALLSTLSLSAQSGLPPIHLGKKYVTEFSSNTVTFKPLEFRHGDHAVWAKVRIIEGRGVKKELGEVVWLNLSLLKVIAEAKDEHQTKEAKPAGAPVLHDKLVGKWDDPDGQNWEYFSDGTFLLSQKDKKLKLIGKWRRMEDGRVKVEYTVLGNSAGEIFTGEVKGDDMTVTNSKGNVRNWKRVK